MFGIKSAIKNIISNILMPPTICLNDIYDKTLIFSQESFNVPLFKDVFGKEHDFFKAYSIQIPNIYLCKIPNAYCIGDREEIWTEKKGLIIDHTTQEKIQWKIN